MAPLQQGRSAFKNRKQQFIFPYQHCDNPIIYSFLLHCKPKTPHAPVFPELLLTNLRICGYNREDICKMAKKRRVRCPLPVREPRKVGGGTVKPAEHGLGAGPVNHEPVPGSPVTDPQGVRRGEREARWYRASFCRPWVSQGAFYL